MSPFADPPVLVGCVNIIWSTVKSPLALILLLAVTFPVKV